MRRLFQLYLREHHSGWFTASVLTMPNYAAFGPHPSALREQIAEVLAQDLATKTLILRGETHFEDLVLRSLNLELKAVQHERVITVPMRFTVLHRRLDKDDQTFEIRIPRIGAVFRIFGEENITTWAEEIIRGHFHLKEVGTLLAHQYEKSERVEDLEVVYHGAGRYKKKDGAQSEPARAEEEKPAHPLSATGTELTEEAKQGRLPRAQFRDALVSELMGILSSRRNPSALLVGPSGVGKTALVQEVAHRIAAGAGGARLEGSKIWFISGSRMIAGARFLGEWQARVQWIVERIQAERDILYAGNILELLSSDTGKTGLNVAQFLLPVIQAGDLSVIVEATPDAASAAEAINAPFLRAFQRLPVPELAAEHTQVILERAAQRLEREQHLAWGPGAVSAALDIVSRFGDAEALPGSGLELLEQMVRIAPAAATAAPGKRRVIAPRSAIEAFSRSSGFPQALLDQEQLLDVASVRRFFESRVIGQSRAMELLTNVIMLLKAGLNDPSKPLGSFLFMGPTGVGKTESALTLAEYLFGDRKRLLRFDMSELGYPGSALRLVDGPDGQGELTKAVREQPFAVVLFDEIEKADSGVFDVLLQVLGEGRLTDGTGRTVRFTHTIVIMTSNLGAVRKEAVGFADGGARRLDRHYLDAAAKFFRPEMVNRIDHLVPFGDLGPESVRAIAVRLVDSAIAREGFSRRGLEVRWEDGVIEVLMRAGFDPKYGARPMKRAVESAIMVPLAKLLVTWPHGQGGRITVTGSGGEIGLRAEPG